MLYKERENAKSLFSKGINDKGYSESQKLQLSKMLILNYYCRSLESSGLDTKHPDFNQYASMYLQTNGQQRFPVKIFEKLIKTYGLSDGMPTGTYAKF